jgi:hypothetical protein
MLGVSVEAGGVLPNRTETAFKSGECWLENKAPDPWVIGDFSPDWVGEIIPKRRFSPGFPIELAALEITRHPPQNGSLKGPSQKGIS